MKWEPPFSRALARALYKADLKVASERLRKRLLQMDQKPNTTKRQKNLDRKGKQSAKVLKLHRSGKSFTQIGAKCGFSAERARQLVEYGMRLDSMSEIERAWHELRSYSLRCELQLRVKNAYDGPVTPAEILASGIVIEQLAWLPNIGPGAVGELRVWMKRYADLQAKELVP